MLKNVIKFGNSSDPFYPCWDGGVNTFKGELVISCADY